MDRYSNNYWHCNIVGVVDEFNIHCCLCEKRRGVVMCKGLQTLRGTRVRVRRVGVEVRIF